MITTIAHDDLSEIQPNPGEVPESEIELFLTILNDERDDNNYLLHRR